MKKDIMRKMNIKINERDIKEILRLESIKKSEDYYIEDFKEIIKIL